MNPKNSTPYGSKNRYGVSGPARLIGRRTGPGEVRVGRRSETVSVAMSAVLLLVRLEDLVGQLGRVLQRAGRVTLAQNGALHRVVQLHRRVADAGHGRREVHVRHLFGERLEVRQLLELAALLQAGQGRDLGALGPLRLSAGEPVDE